MLADSHEGEPEVPFYVNELGSGVDNSDATVMGQHRSHLLHPNESVSTCTCQEMSQPRLNRARAYSEMSQLKEEVK